MGIKHFDYKIFLSDVLYDELNDMLHPLNI
jgi:hypothetical protein